MTGQAAPIMVTIRDRSRGPGLITSGLRAALEARPAGVFRELAG